MKISRIRDLTLISIDENRTMVIACDSCGSVGMKEGDFIKVPNFYVGKFTARVALMEVLSLGAKIVTVADAVCNEMEPTGRDIIMGIKNELEIAGIDQVALTGSTEENFKTTSTGLGVTVIGIADNNKLKVNNIKEDCLLISIGTPKIGNEIGLDKDEDIVDYSDLYSLLNNEDVYEIVPVGSKGILYEGELLAESNKIKLILEENININMKKSGGPVTVLIAAVSKKAMGSIMQMGNVHIIGRLEREMD